MNKIAATIRELRFRAERHQSAAWATPIWGVSEGYEQAYTERDICYRLKDHFADLSYADRCNAAADWLESRASAATLGALYPSIAIR